MNSERQPLWKLIAVSLQKPLTDFTARFKILRYQVLKPNLDHNVEYFSIIEISSLLVSNTTNPEVSWEVEAHSEIVLKPHHFTWFVSGSISFSFYVPSSVYL